MIRELWLVLFGANFASAGDNENKDVGSSSSGAPDNNAEDEVIQMPDMGIVIEHANAAHQMEQDKLNTISHDGLEKTNEQLKIEYSNAHKLSDMFWSQINTLPKIYQEQQKTLEALEKELKDINARNEMLLTGPENLPPTQDELDRLKEIEVPLASYRCYVKDMEKAKNPNLLYIFDNKLWQVGIEDRVMLAKASMDLIKEVPLKGSHRCPIYRPQGDDDITNPVELTLKVSFRDTSGSTANPLQNFSFKATVPPIGADQGFHTRIEWYAEDRNTFPGAVIWELDGEIPPPMVIYKSMQDLETQSSSSTESNTFSILNNQTWTVSKQEGNELVVKFGHTGDRECPISYSTSEGYKLTISLQLKVNSTVEDFVFTADAKKLEEYCSIKKNRGKEGEGDRVYKKEDLDFDFLDEDGKMIDFFNENDKEHDKVPPKITWKTPDGSKLPDLVWQLAPDVLDESVAASSNWLSAIGSDVSNLSGFSRVDYRLLNNGKDRIKVAIRFLSQGNVAELREIMKNHPELVNKTYRRKTSGEKDSEKTCLMHACKNGKYPLVVQEFLDTPNIDVNAQVDTDRTTALMYACESGNSEIIEKLVTFPDLNVNAQDANGQTALVISCVNDRVQVVKHLLKHPQLDLNVQDFDGRTPLMHATHRGYLQIFQFLFNHAPATKVDLSVKDNFGQNILTHACHIDHRENNKEAKVRNLKGSPDIVRALLELDPEGKILNTKDKSQRTPLIIACKNKLPVPEIVEALVGHSHIKIDEKDKNGKTALDFAKDRPKSHQAIIAMLTR